MLFSIALHVVGAAFLSCITTAQQISNDPPSYFGGTQNQEYLDWVGSGIDTKYNSSVYLPSIDQANGAAVHWTVDGDWLHIAVAARCSGWIGFGISEAGGMKGSDMALVTASRPTEIIDAHVVENRVPEEDSCQQDWILSDSSIVGEFLAFEARRKLDTGDPQDKKIVDDSDQAFPPSRIIAAWGNTVEVSYHGTNVARGSVRFYSGGDDESSFQALVETNSEGSFLVFTNNFTIPSEEETNYIDFCVSRSDLIAQGVPNTTDALYLIGFRPIVSPLSAAYVHHFVVTASMDSTESACGEDADANNLVYVWAPGDGPLALPSNLGAPLFGSDGYQSFTMEVHYHNPSLDSGIVDNSGVEFFFTSEPREFEVGVLQVGDPNLEYFGSPVGDGLSLHTFECSTDCSTTFLDNGEPVTVFREHLHMHATGTRITNEQLRSGEVVRSSSVEVWEFDQNGNPPIQQDNYQIQPGDSFRTSCFYRGEVNTTFGLGSANEMCISYLYYYPRKSLEVENFTIPWLCGYSEPGLEFCFNDYTSSALADERKLNREFGTCLSDTDPKPADDEEPVELSGSVAKVSFGSLYVVAALILAQLL